MAFRRGSGAQAVDGGGSYVRAYPGNRLGAVGGDCVKHPAGGRSAQIRRREGVRREVGSCGIALMMLFIATTDDVD